MVNDFILQWFYVKEKLLSRHRNVLKSTRKVKVLSRLAGGYPRGCNVGIYENEEAKEHEVQQNNTPEKREKHRIETYIENNIAGNNRKPPIYMWCGTEDGLLQSNRDTRDLLISKGFDVTYSESEGGHEWRCWDEQFRRSLDFFGI